MELERRQTGEGQYTASSVDSVTARSPFRVILVSVAKTGKKKLSTRLLCKDAVTMVTPRRFHHSRSAKAVCFSRDSVCWLTCSLVHVQADELGGAFVWRPAVFAVLHMLSAWAEAEGVVVSHQEHLTTPTQQGVFSANRKNVFTSVKTAFHLRFVSLLDVDVLCINISVNVLVGMDVMQRI